MTEKQAIMVLEMVEAHGALPKKAKAMAIEALRLADRVNNILFDYKNDKSIDAALDEVNAYVDAVGDYNSYISAIDDHFDRIMQEGTKDE